MNQPSLNYRKIKSLNITDKHGTWSQIEITSGAEKGMRRPMPEPPPKQPGTKSLRAMLTL